MSIHEHTLASRRPTDHDSWLSTPNEAPDGPVPFEVLAEASGYDRVRAAAPELSESVEPGEPIPDPTGPCRVLLIGDVHGNLDWLSTCAKLGRRWGCPHAIQLGDFGFWPSGSRGRINLGWLMAVANAFDRQGVALRVVDANRDASPLAREAFAELDNGVRPIVAVQLDWADRGSVWTWQGVRFGALGGSVSIDKALRTKDVNWWPTEQTTPAEAQLLIERSGGRIDVLLCHDSPILPPGVDPVPGALGAEVDLQRAVLAPPSRC